MKTQLQELFEYESDLTNMFDSDVRVAGALLEYIRTNKKDMLEKEKKLKTIDMKFTAEEIEEIRDLICEEMDRTGGNISDNLTNALWNLHNQMKLSL